MDKIEHLKSTRLCRGLNPDELAKIAAIARISKIDRGQILFFEGDDAHGFFILLEGAVKIYKSSPEGREQILHRIHPGQIFAEVAIFHGGTYPANCSAIKDSVVAFFPKNEFISMIENNPQISLKIIASMAGFLREFTEMVENLSLREVPSRISSYLQKIHARTGKTTIKLETSKAELAKQLGTQSETFSRGLRKLIDNGIIEVNGKTIKILNPDRLSDIAEGEKI